MSDEPTIKLCPDTSSNSLLHRLARQGGRPDSTPPRRVSVYLLVLAVTYVPLLIAVLVDAKFWSIALWDGITSGSFTFFEDWGLNYALLISLPSLVLLLVSDEYLLRTALDEVQQDGVLALSEKSAKSLKKKWNRYFRIANLVTQLAAIGLGIVLAIVTVRLHLQQNISSWITPDRHLYVAGCVYVYCISVLYAIIIFYVTRSIVISLFLRKLVASNPLRILPLHPDKCGGLRPVGRLGLRNQYTLTILGINIVLLLLIWRYAMKGEVPFGEIMIAGSAAYVILGPVIFMAPLLPFRAAMQHAKKEWTHEFARLVRVEIDRLRGQLTGNTVSQVDEKSIERLRQVGAAIDELPIWPFDPSTLRKFATAYVVPLALPLIGQAIKVFPFIRQAIKALL